MRFWILTAALLGASPARAASRCEAEFTMPRLISALASGKVARGQVDSRDIISYYVYQALGAGDEKPCGALKNLSFKSPDGMTWADNCRTVYFELAFGRALATGSPKLPRVCEGALSTDRDFAALDRKQIAQVCAMKPRPIPAFCGRLAALFGDKEPERRRLCLRYLGSLILGEGQACAESSDTEDISRCKQYVLFHNAKGDAARCGTAEICLAFMGKGAAVAGGYAAKVKDRVCPLDPNF